MIETWIEKENEIKEHDGDRDVTIKKTEAQETGRYNEWD